MKTEIIESKIRPVTFSICIIMYIIIGFYFALSGENYYTADSLSKIDDILMAKIWLVLSVIISALIYRYIGRLSSRITGWLILMSIYFLVLYALLYKGTDFGMNGFWGDNANRMALITKYREFGSIFQDWYYKDLPSFYPPLWFFLCGKLSWLFGVEGYKTVKLGYYVIFALYPITLYFVWKKIVSKTTAFVITFLVIFLKDIHLDYVYYEHITAAFFIPWWLYYIEDIKKVRNKNSRWYIIGGLWGALIFMTYYYWFYIGIIATFLRWIISFLSNRRTFLQTPRIMHKFYIALGVTLFTSIYWAPLLWSVIKFGSASAQSKWFHTGYLSIDIPFFEFSVFGLLYLIGLIYMGARYRRLLNANYILFLSAMLLMILLDKFLCLFESSIQTRKLIELTPVFLAVPAGCGLNLFYRVITRRAKYIRTALMFVLVAGLLYFGNNHSQLLHLDLYKKAIDSRIPESGLAIFKSVDYRGKVFLTERYIDAAFLPYYLFISRSGSATHIASQYESRIEFLKYIGGLTDPAQVAYLLKKNRFDAVDYFLLPFDSKKNKSFLEVYPLHFVIGNQKLRLEFAPDVTIKSEYFELKHKAGLYEILPPHKSITDIFIQKYDSLSLESVLAEYNRLNHATEFMPKGLSDSLKPYRDKLEKELFSFISIKPLTELNNGVILEHIDIYSDLTDNKKLRLIFKAGDRFREDFKIFVHAYPLTDGLKGNFINLDINPIFPTSHWIKNELILLERGCDLDSGQYYFHIGLFNSSSGQLKKTFKSGPLDCF